MPALRPLWADFSYFEHQEVGIRWMLDKETNGIVVSNRDKSVKTTVRGGLQCDDMGLGKTIQITATILNNKLPKTLIVAPLAMIDTWSDVCKKAGFNVYEIQHKEWTCMTDACAIPKHLMKMRPAIYITNYEKIPHCPSLFKHGYDRIVLDEAHKIRNGDGELAMYCRSLVAPIRWAVTGTPLVNAKSDLVSLLAFVGVPYSPLWRYDRSYDDILPQLVIHRSLNSLRSVIKGAPPVPEIITKILPFATPEEEEFYTGIQGVNEAMALKYAKDILSSTEKFKFLLRLRQLSVHPQVYINAMRRESRYYAHDDWELPCTKVKEVMSIIEEDCADADANADANANADIHKYIIFCQFNEEAALIRESLLRSTHIINGSRSSLSARGLVEDENILFYNGSMTQKERAAVLLHSKQSTETTVMIIQLQAGGVGLNLQEYDRIIFMSPWWTSALMDQAIARAVRMGQKKVVKVFHLLLAVEQSATYNIDKIMNDKAEEKRYMLQKIFTMCEAANTDAADVDTDAEEEDEDEE